MNKIGMTQEEINKFERNLTMLLTEVPNDAVYFQRLVLASNNIAKKLSAFELDFYDKDKNNT